MTSTQLRSLLSGRHDESEIRDALDAANARLVLAGRPRINATAETLLEAAGEAADALDGISAPAKASPQEAGFRVVHFGPESPSGKTLEVAEVIAPAGAEKLLADLEEATKQGLRQQFIDRNFTALRALVAAAR